VFNWLKLAKTQVQALKALAADAGLLGQIAYHLRHSPGTWLYVYPGTAFHADINLGVREIYPDLSAKAEFVTSSTKRWTLVKLPEHLLPVIFLSKGPDTHVYRLVFGSNTAWLQTLYDEVSYLLLSKGYAGGDAEKVPAVDTSKLVALARDPNWHIGGVQW